MSSRRRILAPSYPRAVVSSCPSCLRARRVFVPVVSSCPSCLRARRVFATLCLREKTVLRVLRFHRGFVIGGSSGLRRLPLSFQFVERQLTHRSAARGDRLFHRR